MDTPISPISRIYIGILEGSLGVGFRVYHLYLGVISIGILEGSFLLPAKI